MEKKRDVSSDLRHILPSPAVYSPRCSKYLVCRVSAEVIEASHRDIRFLLKRLTAVSHLLNRAMFLSASFFLLLHSTRGCT